VTGVQTCALPIYSDGQHLSRVPDRVHVLPQLVLLHQRLGQADCERIQRDNTNCYKAGHFHCHSGSHGRSRLNTGQRIQGASMNRLQGISFGLLKSKVVLIVTGIVIVLLFVWWFAWMTPEANKLTTVQQQVTADNSMVTQLNMELIALKAEQKLVLRELPYLKKVTAAIPPTEDPPGIVDSLNTLANKTGCDLLSVTPANFPSPSGTAGLSVISVSFSISGTHKNIF